MSAARTRAGVLAVSLLALAVALAACEVSVDSSESDLETSDGAAVEQAIAEQLTDQAGVRPDSVSCPEQLVHEEGKSYECTVVHPTEGEQIIDVTMQAPTGFEWLVRG
jgi:hypothetical protein